MPRTTIPKKLSCGGKGPCCHVGYAHKHCEHCDVVISLVSYTLPYYNPVLQHPWGPYWANAGPSQQIGNNFGDVGNAAAADINFLNTHQGNTGDFATTLGVSADSHSCAALPAGG